jgi:hypothetical protein
LKVQNGRATLFGGFENVCRKFKMEEQRCLADLKMFVENSQQWNNTL